MSFRFYRVFSSLCALIINSIGFYFIKKIKFDITNIGYNKLIHISYILEIICLIFICISIIIDCYEYHKFHIKKYHMLQNEKHNKLRYVNYVCIFLSIIIPLIVGFMYLRAEYGDKKDILIIKDYIMNEYAGKDKDLLRNNTQNDNNCCFYRNSNSTYDFSLWGSEYENPTEIECPQNWQSVCQKCESTNDGESCVIITKTPCNCNDILIGKVKDNIKIIWITMFVASTKDILLIMIACYGYISN